MIFRSVRCVSPFVAGYTGTRLPGGSGSESSCRVLEAVGLQRGPAAIGAKIPADQDSVSTADVPGHVRLVEPDDLDIASGVTNDRLRGLHLLAAAKAPPADAPHGADYRSLLSALQFGDAGYGEVSRRVVAQKTVYGGDAKILQLGRNAGTDAPDNRRRRFEGRCGGRRRYPFGAARRGKAAL